ncbi:snRNA-activating protein of 50kDa MW C terminal-domain-containing protein [Thelephora terrestris]|uniref:snRNA-activating protein of 50kDa MW C terminal-domain-containing protein n=1 Tax=Thelephora terrestris TaxID=56493 RepID=A0A9P6HQY0_9AGAM|nr:snRNA-activating protein of 50kDa MW C terminal-domain-containing protein [Thelephora terrestris]
MANPNSNLAFESRFGPQSNLIDIAAFAQSASNNPPALPVDEIDHDIAQECRVDDLKISLEDVLNNPRLAAHVFKNHELTVNAIHESADTSGKRKRRRMNLPEPALEHPEVTALQRKLDAVKLKSWPYLLDSAAFLRGPRYTDLNPFTEPKPSSSSNAAAASSNNEAVLTVTVFHRLPYRLTAVARSSQHAALTSQNLGDLVNCIPCVSNEMPEEVYEDDELAGYSPNTTHKNPGAVVLIEGVLYGDDQGDQDYANKLIKQLEELSLDQVDPLVKSPTSLNSTPLSFLSLKLNKPYWFLHQGDCEHFLVFDQIRMIHPTDPKDGYPLTLQITPPQLDLCRGCSRVPAVWSIVGDVRLGESPCPLCHFCWTMMGMPKDEQAAQGILAVPLPRHVAGWR